MEVLLPEVFIIATVAPLISYVVYVHSDLDSMLVELLGHKAVAGHSVDPS